MYDPPEVLRFRVNTKLRPLIGLPFDHDDVLGRKSSDQPGRLGCDDDLALLRYGLDQLRDGGDSARVQAELGSGKKAAPVTSMSAPRR